MKVSIGKYPKGCETPRRINVQIDPFDLCDLDHTLSIIIVSALKRFRENTTGHPGHLNSQEEWHEILDKMIWSFEWIVEDDETTIQDPVEVQEGLDLFAKYFRSLWT